MCHHSLGYCDGARVLRQKRFDLNKKGLCSKSECNHKSATHRSSGMRLRHTIKARCTMHSDKHIFAGVKWCCRRKKTLFSVGWSGLQPSPGWLSVGLFSRCILDAFRKAYMIIVIFLNTSFWQPLVIAPGSDVIEPEFMTMAEKHHICTILLNNFINRNESLEKSCQHHCLCSIWTEEIQRQPMLTDQEG